MDASTMIELANNLRSFPSPHVRAAVDLDRVSAEIEQH
jgi:hypothetical protein